MHASKQNNIYAPENVADIDSVEVTFGDSLASHVCLTICFVYWHVTYYHTNVRKRSLVVDMIFFFFYVQSSSVANNIDQSTLSRDKCRLLFSVCTGGAVIRADHLMSLPQF